MKKWKFWFIDSQGREVDLGVKECVKPSSTGIWKSLKRILNAGDASEIGYEIVGS